MPKIEWSRNKLTDIHSGTDGHGIVVTARKFHLQKSIVHIDFMIYLEDDGLSNDDLISATEAAADILRKKLGMK